MSCNVFVVLALLLTISKLGNALKCNRCYYQSNQTEDSQKCTSRTEDCSTGYCFTAAYTRVKDGISIVQRGCDDNPNDRLCPNITRKCESGDLMPCAGICCSSDNCNNYTPNTNSATGVISVKFILCLMAIFGYFLA